MRRIGLSSVEVIPYKADGRTAYGDWIIPRAWDAHEAVVQIVRPERAAGVLTRYPDEPCTLFMYSAPTPSEGIVAEVVSVDDPSSENLSGKILLTSDLSGIQKRLRESGALGVICDRGKEEAPDAVPWDNYAFAPRNEEGFFGFHLSKRRGERLMKLIQAARSKGERLAVHVKINTQLYDGTSDIVTARIPGDTDEEVLGLAHLYEVGANDNASGSGMLLEAFRTLKRLMDRGELSHPRRSLRILLGFECGGFMAYTMNHSEVLERTLAAINPDMAGEDIEKCGTSFAVHLNPHAAPSFTDVLIQKLFADLIASKDPLFRWRVAPFSICDSFIADPMIGVPSVSIIGLPDRFYHSSSDTPDKMSSDTLAKIGSAATTYLYFLAHAGAKEARWLAYEVAAYARRKIISESQELVSAFLEAPESDPRTTLAALKDRLNYSADRKCLAVRSTLRLVDDPGASQGFTSQLDSLERAIHETVEGECRAFEHVVKSVSSAAPSDPQPKKRSSLEEKASRMIPRRLVPGPLTLETLPPKEDGEYRWKPGWSAPHNVPLLWIDGERTLFEAWQMAAQETDGKGIELKEFVAYVEFLEEHGYMEIRH